MDITYLTQLIGSLGFPIVCCGYMMISMNKTIQNNTKVTSELSAIVQRLVDKLDFEEQHKND